MNIFVKYFGNGKKILIFDEDNNPVDKEKFIYFNASKNIIPTI
jgi:hypothetical protein